MPKAIVHHDGKRQLDVAVVEPIWQAHTTVLHQLHLNIRMTAMVLGEKRRKRVLDNHGCRTKSQYSAVTLLQSSRPLSELANLGQKPSTSPEQVFTLRG